MARLVFGKQPIKAPRANFEQHPGQEEISDAIREHLSKPLELQPNIIEIIAGRGWGKTLYFVAKILMPYLNLNPDAKVLWVAPTYLIAHSPITDVFEGVNEATGERWVDQYDASGAKIWEFATTKSGPTLTWWNGATVTFRSAEAPESIVSRGYNLIIIDEAALVPEQVFTLQILGTARKAGIKIFLITTPRGKKHWTYKFFLKGQDAQETNYLSFQQNFKRNPYFNPTLASLIKDIPEWLYRQEYLAEFIDDGDSVFRGIEHVLDGPERSFPNAQQEWCAELTDIMLGDVKRKAIDRRFVCGLDLAKSVDYTVYWVMDTETGECVHYKRINKTDYKDILRIAQEICQKWNNADLVFDSTGVGAGLADMMSNYDINAHPFTFTNESKNELVTKLAVSIEHGQIKLPNIKTIINEFSIYTYSITSTGKISYSAPSGLHDDIVMAAGLANLWRCQNNGTDEVTVLEAVNDFNERGHAPGSFLNFMENDND